MQITQKVTPSVIAAATGLLQPYCPELSPQSLVSALQEYQSGKAAPILAERPLTRREAATLLQCSLNTVSRYLSAGKLRRITLTERSCRIDADSVRNLLAGNDSIAEG